MNSKHLFFKSAFVKMSLVMVFAFFALNANAQNWETVQEGDVSLEEARVICKSSQGFDYEYAVIKLTNNTNEAKVVSLNYQAWYGDGCRGNCNTEKEEYTDKEENIFTIPANGVVEGTCDSRRPLRTFAYSLTEHPNAFKGKLTSLSFENVKIIK